MESPDRSKEIETLVLFPGALGDFLCMLPTLVALRAATHGTLLVAANSDWLELLRLPKTRCVSLQRREVADLFRAEGDLEASTRALLGGFRTAYSWTGHGDPEFARRLARLGRNGDGSVATFPFRGMRPDEHAASYFARCVGVPADAVAVDAAATTATVREHLRLDPTASAGAGLHDGRTSGRRLVVHPGSGSARKSWTGFAAAIERWRATVGAEWDVVEIRGPAESRMPPLPGTAVVRERRLPEIAALLANANLYFGNDSGISHLAGLLGVPGLVLFGPSDPQVWRPLGGSLKILHEPRTCERCGDVLCAHRIAPQQVVAELARIALRRN